MHKKQNGRKCTITGDKKDGGWNQETAANWWHFDCWSIGLQYFDLWRIWFCSSKTKNEVKQVYLIFHLQYDTRLSAQHTFYELRSIYCFDLSVKSVSQSFMFLSFLFCCCCGGFFVSAIPLKPLNRISLNFVGMKDILCICAYSDMNLNFQIINAVKSCRDVSYQSQI